MVKALKVRDGSPLDVPLMLFAWDKEAGMHVYKGEKPREEKEKRKERELVNVARDIFGRQTHITYICLLYTSRIFICRNVFAGCIGCIYVSAH